MYQKDVQNTIKMKKGLAAISALVAAYGLAKTIEYRNNPNAPEKEKRQADMALTIGTLAFTGIFMVHLLQLEGK